MAGLPRLALCRSSLRYLYLIRCDLLCKQIIALDGKYFRAYSLAIATQEVAVKAQAEFREWIKQSGLKLGWVATQLPVSMSALSRWLNGRGIPAAVYRERLADISGVEAVRDEENWK